MLRQHGWENSAEKSELVPTYKVNQPPFARTVRAGFEQRILEELCEVARNYFYSSPGSRIQSHFNEHRDFKFFFTDLIIRQSNPIAFK